MEFLSPLNPPFYLTLSGGWVSWLGWLVLFGLLAWVMLTQHEAGWRWTRREWLILAGLAAGTIIFRPFFGIRLPALGALPPPGRREEPRGPALMLFIHVPWMLAAGLFGPLPAAVLALISGLING